MAARSMSHAQTTATIETHNSSPNETAFGAATVGWLRRVPEETKHIICFTAKHFQTALRCLANQVRRRANSGAINGAKLQLGERAYDLVRGDAEIRKQIAMVDYRIRNVHEGDGELPQLEAERRGLIKRLADGLDEPLLQEKIDGLAEAKENSDRLERTLRRETRRLFPTNRAVQARIATGYSVLAAGLLILGMLYSRGDSVDGSVSPHAAFAREPAPSTHQSPGGADLPNVPSSVTSTTPPAQAASPAAVASPEVSPPQTDSTRNDRPSSSAKPETRKSTPPAQTAKSTARSKPQESRTSRSKSDSSEFDSKGYSNPELFRRIYERSLEETDYDDSQLAAYLQPFLETFFQSREAPISKSAYFKVSRHMTTRAFGQILAGYARQRRGGPIRSTEETTFRIVGNLRNGRADARLFYSRHGCDSPVARRFFANVEYYIRRLGATSLEAEMRKAR